MSHAATIADAPLILVVDDEADLVRLVEFNLREAGMQTAAAATGAQALTMAARLQPAVVVLDVMLPDIAGTEVCRAMRADEAFRDTGIILLTARGADEDRVAGLELGADDYVVKPFNVRELMLRVRALARRSMEQRIARERPASGGTLRWQGLELDPLRHRLLVDGVETSLRPMEFRLLSLLIERPGELFSRERLLEEVWGAAEGISPRAVDTHVRRLRERLGPYGAAIETVFGQGYRLRAA